MKKPSLIPLLWPDGVVVRNWIFNPKSSSPKVIAPRGAIEYELDSSLIFDRYRAYCRICQLNPLQMMTHF